MKKILIPISALLVSGLAHAQVSTTENYVQTKTYLDYNGTTPSKTSETVQYFDGLGRPKQVVNVKTSPLGRDVVTPIVYDGFGRQVKDYLPIPQGNTLNGAIVTDPLGNSSTIYGGEKIYAEKVLENSPLDRIQQQIQVGTDWSTKPVKFEYDTNIDGEVKKYVATFNYTTFESLLSLSGNYGASQLYKNAVTDEDGNKTIEFKNGEGQVVLVRKVNGSENVDTYYVYNDYNQLAYVIPPLAAVSGSTNEATLNNLCYQYKYDVWNRLVEKKVPGKGWEYMVYDKADRLVMTQDAVMEPQSRWLMTKYDQFGRVAYTAIISGGSRESMQSQANANVIVESRHSGGFTQDGMQIFYTNNYFHVLEKVLTVNYYDNYPSYGFNPSFPATILDQPVLTDTVDAGGLSTKSLPVMSLVKNIEDDNWTKNYTYYDTRGRAIGSYSINHLGGRTQVFSKLDFSGTVQQSITRHKRLDTDTDKVITENFTYDHQNRLLTHTHQVDSNPAEYLAQNDYNELSQLRNKKVGGTDVGTPLQSIDYSYNIRGWMTKINDPKNLAGKLFGYEIKYNQVEGLEIPNLDYTNLKVKPRYNGNIAEVDWRTNTSSNDNLRRYGYAYDELNRLVGGFYQKDTNPSGKEYFEKIDYDFNGNITRLKRSGSIVSTNKGELIDDLVYLYTGNKLITISDKTQNSSGYPTITKPNTIIYDNNGNMISHKDKRIDTITYNLLNLPSTIKEVAGKPQTVVNNIYRADGSKLNKIRSSTQDIYTTDYLDGFQYTFYQGALPNINPMGLQFVPTSEGYFDFVKNKYIYNYTDHLGNVRLSYLNNGTGIEVLEENNYYPFGLKHENYNVLPGNPSYHYKYNGKELQETGMYDYGARFYMPDIGRWFSPDPLSEEYRRWSPYNYAMNNPINFIDPDGRGVASTGVRDNKDGTYTVVNAKNDGNTGVYITDEKGNYDINSSQKIAETHLPTEFMQADNITGEFKGHIDATFSLNPEYNMRIDGKSYKNLDGNDIKNIYVNLFKQKTKGMGWLDTLSYLRDNSGNGKKFDIKASVKGLSPQNVVMLDGKLTTIRGLGNEIFGANMAQAASKASNWGMSKEFFYHQVMPEVGAYNQSQNKGATGYNSGWPFYGEHTFSGSYIFHGYYGRFPYRTDIKY